MLFSYVENTYLCSQSLPYPEFYMKPTYLLQLSLFTIILLFCGTSCENTDERISTLEEVIIEGNNNSVEIRMTRSDWKVTSITTLDGWSPLVDDNNSPLKLDGLGTLRFHWGYIIRDKEDALIIQTDENLIAQERGFVIHLSNGIGLYKEKIIVRQKIGDAYELKNIEFTLEEGDGEAENGGRPYGSIVRNRTDVNTTFTIYPFINMAVECEFFCDNQLFFNLLKGEEPQIDAPEIVNGKIHLTGEKIYYSQYLKRYESRLKYTELEVETPSQKQTRVTGLVFYKWNQMTYTATLINIRTQEERVIRGKLVKIFPYYHNRPKIEVSELPD